MNQTSLFDQNDEEKMMARAREWIAQNLDAWSAIVVDAHDRARAGKPISIAKMCEDLRYDPRVIKPDREEFKVDNSLRAPLARILVHERPECAPYIRMRRSKVDILP